MPRQWSEDEHRIRAGELHRGLPVASANRAGYLSAEDKALLDALRAGTVTAAAAITATAAAAAAGTIQTADLNRHEATPHGGPTYYEQEVLLTPGTAMLATVGGVAPPTLVTASALTNIAASWLSFADAASQSAWWDFIVPRGYNGQNIIACWHFKLVTTTNAAIRLVNRVTRVATDGAIDAADVGIGMGGTQPYGGASYGAGDLYVLENVWNTALPTAGQRVYMRFQRDGANVNDTVNEAVQFLGGVITFPCSL